MKKTSVLFVCLGNICRSPTAEGVFRKKVEQQGLQNSIAIDSAGTSDWHINSSPDSRTIFSAKKRGYDLSTLRGRQVIPQDFLDFDYILAMDGSNLSHLQSMERSNNSPSRPYEEGNPKVELFLNFAIQSKLDDVPDPYHGGEDGFEQVLDLVEEACDGLLATICSQPQKIN